MFRNAAVIMTIIGYWYNIPMLTISFFGPQNKLCLYDIGFAMMILIYLSSDKVNIDSAIRNNQTLHKLSRFVKLCSIMLIPSFVLKLVVGAKFIFFLSTLMLFYHLIGFFILAAYVYTFYRNEKLRLLILVFQISSLVFLIVYYAQIGGVLPNLWPQVYIDMYTDQSISSTVGPNRIVPGMMSFMSFVFSLFILTTNSIKKMWMLKWLSLANIVLIIPAILMIGSRTTWVIFAIFIIVYTIFYNRKVLFIGIILLFIAPVVYSMIVGNKQQERIESNLNYNRDKLLRDDDSFGDVELEDAYQRTGSGRLEIATNYFNVFISHPYIIPFGTGFISGVSKKMAGAASAHNMYFELIFELGIVGLILYFSWLLSYYRFYKNIRNSRRLNKGAIGILPAFIIAQVISLTVGEHLYVFRSLFAIFGSFIFIVTVIQVSIIDFLNNTNDTSI